MLIQDISRPSKYKLSNIEISFSPPYLHRLILSKSSNSQDGILLGQNIHAITANTIQPFISSVRSSNSHPNLLVTHHHTLGQQWLLKQFCLNNPVEHIQKPELPKLYVRLETWTSYFIIHNQFVKYFSLLDQLFCSIFLKSPSRQQSYQIIDCK